MYIGNFLLPSELMIRIQIPMLRENQFQYSLFSTICNTNIHSGLLILASSGKTGIPMSPLCIEKKVIKFDINTLNTIVDMILCCFQFLISRS